MYDLTLKNEWSRFVISIPKCALYTIKAPENIFHSVRSNEATAETNCQDSNCLPQGLGSRLPRSHLPRPLLGLTGSAQHSSAEPKEFVLRSTFKLSCP